MKDHSIGIVLLWWLNLAISILNALSVGAVWSEIKEHGNLFNKFTQWCGAIMSATGFIWCYLMLETYVLQKFNVVNDRQIYWLWSLGYSLIIVPVIGSGFGICTTMWMEYYRSRRIRDAIIAGYDTFAQARNMYGAIKGIPAARRGIRDMVDSGFSRKRGSWSDGSPASSRSSSSRSSSSSDDDSEGGGIIVVLLVLFAAVGGILTTWGLIAWADRKWVVQMHGQWSDAKRENFSNS